jgi:serine/threonine protein kinase
MPSMTPQGQHDRGRSSYAVRTVDGAAPEGERLAKRYRLLRSLGCGGHGEVWEAHDDISDAVVAVKLIGRDFDAASARVRREISAVKNPRQSRGLVRDGAAQSGRFMSRSRAA